MLISRSFDMKKKNEMKIIDDGSSIYNRKFKTLIPSLPCVLYTANKLVDFFTSKGTWTAQSSR